MTGTRLPPFTPRQERFGLAAVKLMNRVNRWVYRLTSGRIGGRFLRGAPVCLLTVRGRKTGQPRTVALLYLVDGDDVIVVASLGGMSQHPLWYRNLVADPDVTLRIGARERAMTARRVSGEEKAALWPRLVAMYPDYDDYQGRTTRDIPVIRLSPRGPDAAAPGDDRSGGGGATPGASGPGPSASSPPAG
jgi:deazaflavin-dependent oxidoreductase (nitroreductase family)